jgi:hypothetical protein
VDKGDFSGHGPLRPLIPLLLQLLAIKPPGGQSDLNREGEREEHLLTCRRQGVPKQLSHGSSALQRQPRRQGMTDMIAAYLAAHAEG